MKLSDTRVIIHSPMAEGHSGYQAAYKNRAIDPPSELHNHAFYELYFHAHDGETVYINNETYAMDNCTLMIFPPFQMHGIIVRERGHVFERAFLYLTPELIRTLGCSIIDFDRMLSKLSDDGKLVFHVEPDLHRQCIELLKKLASRGTEITNIERL